MFKMRNFNFESTFFQSAKTFFNGKRFLVLCIFALIAGNITLYVTGYFSRKRVQENSTKQHLRIFQTYLETVEKHRRESQPASIHEDPSTSQQSPESEVSPYWKALVEIRKQFPQNKVSILIPESAQIDSDKKVFEILKNKPRGWQFTDESDGWARTFFVLPTKNATALQVIAYIKDELQEWQNTALLLGVYSFVLFLFFGWFWTRAGGSSIGNKLLNIEEHTSKDLVQKKIQAIQMVFEEMSHTVFQVKSSLEHLGKSTNQTQKAIFDTIDEMILQIKNLTVNGLIEAARNAESYRVFHVIFDEISLLAVNARDLLKQLLPQELNIGPLKEKLDEISALTHGILIENSQQEQARDGHTTAQEPAAFSSKSSANVSHSKNGL